MEPTDPGKPILLLKGSVDVRHYDDERALTEYVWKHYRHLLTGLEHRAGRYTIAIVGSLDAPKMQYLHSLLERRYGPVDDAAVIDALTDGRDAFRDRVPNRLLKDHPEDVFINRCPTCERIVRSPSAHQCPWCKHDWHGRNNRKRPG
jgi:hypothetical protein